MSILSEISDQLDSVQNYGHYLSALCPFHDDNNPSLLVYEDNYKCQACGAFGKTNDLLTAISSSSGIIRYRPKKTSDYRNPFTKWTRNKSLAASLKVAWNNNCVSPSIYLQQRGISAKHQKSLGIGYRDDWYTFPIRDRYNKIVGATARRGLENNHSAKYINPSGQDANLLYVPDWKSIIQGTYIIITFGILDAISLYIMGYPGMSTTTGKRLNPSVLDQFRKLIFIIPDHGEEIEAYNLAGQLGWRGKVLCHGLYPTDCKDVNDLFVHYQTHLQGYLNENINEKMAK